MIETLAGQVLTPEGWVAARLHHGAAVHRIEPWSDAPSDRFILPGFIDLHVHGGGGADTMEGAEAVAQLARFHARHGTTALLPTTVTAPVADLLRTAEGVAAARPGPGAARILGLHLEGPFINPAVLGAQPPFAIPPDLGLVDAIGSLVALRVVTMAPEIDEGGRLLAHLLARGVRVQLGHTACTDAQARVALRAGASGFTHLFNAMTPLHHRAPGCVGCALAFAEHAEIILDGIHVAPAAILAALRAIPGLYGVTDAIAAAGMPDGEYRLGTHPVYKRGDTARLADGTLAGSVLTMDGALRTLLGLGLPLAEAARRLSTIPADYLGESERGRIAPGLPADIVVVDAAGRLLHVAAEGVAVL
jgi:N-acetylglucosamine-6-phosphate deacetylase